MYYWRHRASSPMRAPSPVFPGWQPLCPAPRHQICRLPAWCKSEFSGCQPVCLRPVHVRCVHIDATYLFEERHRRSHVREVPRECIKLLARDEANHRFFALKAFVTNSTLFPAKAVHLDPGGAIASPRMLASLGNRRANAADIHTRHSLDITAGLKQMRVPSAPADLM